MSTEMSEDDILQEFGELLWEAEAAFGQDPRYLADMAEAANIISYKRLLWEVRSEAMERTDDPEKVREIITEIMHERGITPPVKHKS